MSHVKVYILAFLASICPLSYGLNCFKCYRSNYRVCDMYQENIKCEENSQCFTLIYTASIKQPDKSIIEEDGFKKGCIPPNTDCQSYCNRYLKYGYKNCKVACCGEDGCNERGFQDMSKAKRSSESDNQSSVSSKMMSTNYSLILSLGFVFFNQLFLKT